MRVCGTGGRVAKLIEVAIRITSAAIVIAKSFTDRTRTA
jgi:hypothetical protein